MLATPWVGRTWGAVSALRAGFCSRALKTPPDRVRARARGFSDAVFGAMGHAGLGPSSGGPVRR